MFTYLFSTYSKRDAATSSKWHPIRETNLRSRRKFTSVYIIQFLINFLLWHVQLVNVFSLYNSEVSEKSIAIMYILGYKPSWYPFCKTTVRHRKKVYLVKMKMVDSRWWTFHRISNSIRLAAIAKTTEGSTKKSTLLNRMRWTPLLGSLRVKSRPTRNFLSV